jgi:LysM repeat protein
VAPYHVAHGDTLWKIAAKHQTTVHRVKEQNGLRSSRIYPGQLLEIPLEN